MATDVGSTLLVSLNNALVLAVGFVPKFVIGLIIILVGIIIASIVKEAVLRILKTLKVEMLLKRYGVPEAKDDLTWTNILSETVRWFLIISFLLPAADIWGLPRVSVLINELLLYVPNVFVAAIIALVGFVIAKISRNVIHASAKGLSAETTNTIASVTHWAIIVFVVLVVLNQLGVATDLIRILFIGFVAMIALAGGLAFGLGGKDTAADILKSIKKKLE
jgi:small-conductance mechanosensitive channel